MGGVPPSPPIKNPSMEYMIPLIKFLKQVQFPPNPDNAVIPTSPLIRDQDLVT